jgi:signal transduction histidine kinase
MRSVATGVIVAAVADQAQLSQLLLFRILPFFGLGVMIAAALGAWLHARWVVRPLARLEQAAASIARGRLDEPVTTARRDEIGLLTHSFDAMRSQLAAASAAQARWQAELEQRVQERTAQVQRLVGRVINAQEEERRRLAQELHDDTAQALATVLLGLEALRDSLPPGQERVRQHVEHTIGAGRRALEDLRRVIMGLRPAAVDDLGVVAALRSYASALLAPLGVRLEFTVQGQERRLPEAVEAGLFRILQEAVNNIAKHARALNARVRLEFQEAWLEATVEDDGQGFDVGQVQPAGPGLRLGLEGMQERADIINARLEVTSTRGKGTRVRVVLPLEGEGHDHS